MERRVQFKRKKTNLQLFKYLIGNDDLENYNTLSFETEEMDRTFIMALDAFDNYCRATARLPMLLLFIWFELTLREPQ